MKSKIKFTDSGMEAKDWRVSYMFPCWLKALITPGSDGCAYDATLTLGLGSSKKLADACAQASAKGKQSFTIPMTFSVCIKSVTKPPLDAIQQQKNLPKKSQSCRLKKKSKRSQG